jgi:DNA-binding NarL/FixJ family response regulator
MTATHSPVRVVIADEHPMVRRSLRSLLDGEPWCQVVAEAGNLSMVRPCVQDHSAHVLVLDLHMSGGSSRELIGELHRRAPGTAIVGVTMERSASFAARVYELGATGYVLKDQADTELAEAVRRAARGVRFTSPCVSPALEKQRPRCAPGRLRTPLRPTADRPQPAS